jgi:L-serine dehydratase
MAESLVIAAGIGAVVAKKVQLAGAVAGCQAEIGVAGSMAAAAGVYLMDGSIDQIEAAATYVLANLLGLSCDPVMGLVEVPCIIRNSAVTSVALTSIEMAMANITYPIPFEEVIDVMKETGEKMHSSLKETSNGGLAKTKTALSLCHRCGKCS